MKIRSTTAGIATLFLLTLSLAPGLALAQGDKPAGAPGMGNDAMQAMMKAATPGEQHKKLQHVVGDWTYTMKMWMAPGQPSMDSTGTMHAAPILGGRYVESVYKGQFMGQPFEGHAVEGYDNAAGQYVSTWMDNASTGIMHSTGTSDSGGKVVTMTAEPMVDPASGQKMGSRQVLTWLDDNNFKMEMFMLDPAGSPSMKVMELTAKRK